MVSFEQLSYEKQSESERATPAVKNKKKVDFTQFLKSLRLQLGTFLICGRDENEPIRVSQSTYLILHLVRTRNDAVDLAYGTYSSISPNNINYYENKHIGIQKPSMHAAQQASFYVHYIIHACYHQ